MTKRDDSGGDNPNQEHGGAQLIPDKLYFRIGEVAELCGVETYVLRFWQTEFAQLRPGKSGTGQRLYRKRDVEMALRIKRLLHDEGYTIAGAKTVLASESAAPARTRPQPEPPLSAGPHTDPQTEPRAEPRTDSGVERMRARLNEVRSELQELLGLLEQRPSQQTSMHPSREPDEPAPLSPESE